MSFYTTLAFYRPTDPPALTAADLAAFVSAFATLGVADAEAAATFGFALRFGSRVDRDDRPADWLEPVIEGPTGGGIFIDRAIDYDTEDAGLPSLAALSSALAALGPQPIYRANLVLGHVVRPIYEALHREPSEQNEVSLGLDSWSMEVGPIVSYDLATEEPYPVGWIAVQASGHGYLYPWTFRDLVRRVEALPQMRALAELCRRTWPVEPGRPPRAVVKTRKAMGPLWPYPRTDQACDWSWGLQESG